MTSFVPRPSRLAFVLCFLVSFIVGTVASSAQTLHEINKANGLYEVLIDIGPGFTDAMKSIPGPLPKNYQEALAIATVGGFNPDKMERAVELRMGDKLTTTDLSELGAFYTSPLGKHVTDLEIQASRPEAEASKAIEGKRILAELPIKDPARLELYRKIADDLRVVDLGEAIALNVGYAMIAGMQSAAKNPLSDQQMMDIMHEQSPHIRPEIERTLMEGSAYTYRDLSLSDLKLYSKFLTSSAGHRYYDQLLMALGAVVADETRAFGHRLSAALGSSKA